MLPAVMKYAAFPLLLAGLCIKHAFAYKDTVSPESLPPPWADSQGICHPGKSISAGFSSVCDPSGLLSEHHISNLDRTLNQIYTGTRPYSLVQCGQTEVSDASRSSSHGFRVAIALVRRMDFDGQTMTTRTENFANTIFSHWHMSENCGASVLLFLSLEDRRMYIKTGETAVNYLNEHQIDDVYSRMIPKLKKTQIAAALHAGLARIGHYLSKYKGEHPRGVSSDGEHHRRSGPLFFRNWPSWWDLELSIVFLIFAVFSVIACCNGVGGIEAAKKRMEKKQVLRKLDIVRDEYFGSMNEHYAPATCPICHDKITLSWEPADAPAAEDESLVEADSTQRRRTVRTLRCGHSFHDNCFEDDYLTPGGPTPPCPVCGDPGTGVTSPEPLRETRMRDVSFRLNRLHDQYPHILTSEVMEKLESEPPNIWPNPMRDSYLKPIQRPRSLGEDDHEQDSRGAPFWSGVGGALAAGGIGALIGSFFGGWGRRDDDSYYSSIGDNNENQGGWGRNSGGGGHGAGWASNISNTFSGGRGGGFGSGWGGGGGGGGGGGHGISFGGGGGGGHGTGW